MPGKENKGKGQESWLSTKIAKVTGVVLALTALVTALVHFRDSIPWLTPVAKIELTPDSVNLDIGDKIQMVAAVKDSDGRALSKRVKWTSANPSLLTVEGDGFVTAGQSAGSTTITAAVGPVKALAQIHIRRVNVATVGVFPPSKMIQVDEHLRFDATPYDSEGNSLLGRPVRWSSENNVVASVDEKSGEAAGKSPGNVKVTAESEGKFSAAAVTVYPSLATEPTEGTQPSAPAPAPPSSPTASGSGAVAKVQRTEVSRKKAPIGARVGAHLPTTEAPSESPQALTTAMRAQLGALVAKKITVVGALKTGECSASVRILIGEKLIDVKSDSQEVSDVPGGDQSYNLHGTVACPGQVLAVANGQGTVTLANQKTYRCFWERKGPKNFVVELKAE